MDKYTVDLDKVLNDFEYSEYSLENAKVNRSIQDASPNSSFNTNHCIRNDTAVKHSINNVFHSLNEYLSSDITPKKIENVQKNFKSIDIANDQHSSRFLMSPQYVKSHSITPQTSQSYHLLEGSAFKNPYQDVPQEDLNIKDYSNTFNNSLADAIDTSSETSAIIPELDILEEKCLPVTNIYDNKDLLDKTPEEQSLNYPQSLVNSDHLMKTINNSEEMLVDLTGNDSCNAYIALEKDIDLPNDVVYDTKEENECTVNQDVDLRNNDTTQNKLYSSDIEVDNNEEIQREICSIQDRISIKNDDINTLGNEKGEEKTVVEEIEHNKIEKIGFANDVEMDEEDIEQYFQELEKELGIQGQEEKYEEIEPTITNNLQLGIEESEVISINEEISITEPSKIGDIDMEIIATESAMQESPVLTKDSSAEEKEASSLQKLELNPEDKSKHNNSSDGTETTSATVNESIKEEKLSQTNVKEPEEQKECLDEIQSEENILTTNASVPETSNAVEKRPEDDPQEQEKNSRPQNLTLVEEAPDTKRKISLIGEPGSTPYNNLYSTKDFGKAITDGNGDNNSARATSPTYSDVSTDSVSSGSLQDTAGHSNPELGENTEKKPIPVESSDVTFKDIVQNNMINTVETSRSDVTMDKDFKNNLKTGNSRTEDGPSTSCPQSNENEGSDVDSQDSEGACTLVIENIPVENQENVGQNEGQSVADSGTGIDWLGKQAPLWIPDNVAMSCLHCDMKFTVIKRRHHCRACGLVLCSKCCNLKYRLEYLNADARVCKKCYDILDKETNSNSGSEVSQESSPNRNVEAIQESLDHPNPNNPSEYCSTIPPTQQVDIGATAVPSVMVPVGVLKRNGSNKGRSNKSVMFCDGIRPGSDLTNLDTDFNYTENQKAEKSRKSPDKSSKNGRTINTLDTEAKSLIPNDERSLPPTVAIFKTDIKYSLCANNSSVVEMLKNESLTFALQSNVFVHVKIINMDCCISRTAWCFSTEGLINVGQDEIVILLEYIEDEPLVPKEIFIHLNYVYLEAVKGSSVKELGMSLHPTSPFLGSKNHFGFIYIRPTFQCLQNLIVPKEPYLIGILIHRWETPWAKLFPLRLVLRLGAEYKYYPSPIISTRERDSVFVEIGHTIIKLLADFRNFSYSLPQIRGLTIHMEDKNTTVTIPKNRYDQVLKSLSNSSDHALAFAGNFSSVADSHLVCIQDTQSATNNYSTHAINICNQPRKVTGASFIVFNGALKSTSGLTAKSNIVEDGLMIQILPEHMLQVRDSLKNMRDHTIKCGCVNEESDETVTIVWGEPDSTFNVGVLSPIDNKSLTGIPSIRVHNGKDYTCNSGNRLIRWTEVFISQSGEDSAKNQDPIDISKISENISKATCQALVKYLDLLVSNSFYKIGLRAHIHIENVSYSAGANNVKLPPIYMKSLDNELVPVLHRIASTNVTEQPIVLELIFRILNI